MMQVYLKRCRVEGREKLYLQTTQNNDETLAVLEVVNSKVDVEEALGTFGFAYPKKHIQVIQEKTAAQKAKEALEQEAECAQLRLELKGLMMEA